MDLKSSTVLMFLALVVVASGCVNSSSSRSANVQLVNFTSPDQVEVGDNFTLGATFSNNGSANGTAYSRIIADTGDGTQDIGKVNLSVPQNTIVGPVQTDEIDMSGLGEVEFTLESYNASTTVELVPRTSSLNRTFSVGEEASNGLMSVKLNSVDYVKNFPDSDIEAEDGNKLVVLDLTITNKDKRGSFTVSSALQSVKIQDSSGYSYNSGYFSNNYLDRGFTSGQILSGDSETGRIAIAVPEDAENLQFRYGFAPYRGNIAKFDLPEKDTRYSLKFAERPEPNATIEIESVDGSSNYLNGVTVSVENTGEIGFKPTVGLTVNNFGNILYSNAQAINFRSKIAPGERSVKTINMFERLESQRELYFYTGVKEYGGDEYLDTDEYSIS